MKENVIVNVEKLSKQQGSKQELEFLFFSLKVVPVEVEDCVSKARLASESQKRDCRHLWFSVRFLKLRIPLEIFKICEFTVTLLYFQSFCARIRLVSEKTALSSIAKEVFKH